MPTTTPKAPRTRTRKPATKVPPLREEAPEPVVATVDASAVPPKPAPVPVPVSATPPRVDPAAFWRMQYHGASAKAAKAEAEAARMSKLYVLALLDPKGRVAKIEKALEDAQKQADQHARSQADLKQAMEALLGKKLANIAIDPDTGDVSDIPPAPTKK